MEGIPIINPKWIMLFVMMFAIVGIANADYWWCYQESANTSHQNPSQMDDNYCGQVYTGTYAFTGSWASPSNLIDGDWNTRDNVFHSSNATQSVNYTVPSLSKNAILLHDESDCSGSCQFGAYQQNTTIPQQCFNVSGNVQIRRTATNDSFPASNNYIDCYNGTAWVNMINYYGSHIYEEGIYWNVSRPDIPKMDLFNQNNQTTTWFRTTDNVSIWCNATNPSGTNISYIWDVLEHDIYNNVNKRHEGGIVADGTSYNFSSFETDNDSWVVTNFDRSNEWAYDGSWSQKVDIDGYNTSSSASLTRTFNTSTNIKLAINLTSFICYVTYSGGSPPEPIYHCPSISVYLNGVVVGGLFGSKNGVPPAYTVYYLDLNTSDSILGNTVSIVATSLGSSTGCGKFGTSPCPRPTTAYVDAINVTTGKGYLPATRVNAKTISGLDLLQQGYMLDAPYRLNSECKACDIYSCSDNNLSYLAGVYDETNTNVSELFETGTQTFNIDFTYGTYPSLAQWVMINNPYNFYMTQRDEAGSNITSFTNQLVIVGDASTNLSYDTSFLFNGSKTGRIDGMMLDQFARIGNPETQNMIYNISICETNVSLLTTNATKYADCNNTPVIVRPNANLSLIFDSLPNTTYMNFTTSFNMTQGKNYILNFNEVSQTNNSIQDFWRIKAQLFTGQTKYRRVIGGVASTFDYITNISFYTNGVPTDTNSLAWENMTQGTLGQWSITKLIPSVDADTPMTYLYRWNDTITERIIPVNTTIKNFQIGLNGSISILNVTFYDELNQSDISPNMTTTSIWKVTFPTGAVQTFSLNTTGTFTINMTPSTAVVQADVEFIYIKNGYRQRTYYLTNATLSGASVTQLRLADIVANDTISSPITFTLKNYNTDILPNYYIDIQRWYVDQNGYSTIAIAKTDVTAKAVVWLQPYLAFYRILVYDNSNNIVYTASRQVISQSDIEIQLQDGMDSNTYEKYSSIQYTFVKNKTLGIVRADLTDTTGSTFTAVMNVNRMGIFGSTTVCNATGGGSATSLICSAPINTSDEYVITVDVTKGGTTFPLISDNLNYKSGEYGLDGIVSAFLIIGTLAFMGLGSPHMAILTTLLGIGISVALGLLVTGVASFVGLIIVGIAMLMVMRR